MKTDGNPHVPGSSRCFSEVPTLWQSWSRPCLPSPLANRAGDVSVNEAVGTQGAEKRATNEQGSICPRGAGKTKRNQHLPDPLFGLFAPGEVQTIRIQKCASQASPDPSSLLNISMLIWAQSEFFNHLPEHQFMGVDHFQM